MEPTGVAAAPSLALGSSPIPTALGGPASEALGSTSLTTETEHGALPSETEEKIALFPRPIEGVTALLISESSWWSFFPFLERYCMFPAIQLYCPLVEFQKSDSFPSLSPVSIPFVRFGSVSVGITPSLFLASAEMVD